MLLLPLLVLLLPAAPPQALQDANWHPITPADQAATGVTIGAGMSCTTEIAEAGTLISAHKLRRVSPYFVPRILVNMAAGAVSIAHGLRGPNHAVSTACATGVHCIGDGFRMVQRGDADVMLAGADSDGFHAVGSLSNSCLLRCAARMHVAGHRQILIQYMCALTIVLLGGVLLYQQQSVLPHHLLTASCIRCNRGLHRRHIPWGLLPLEGLVHWLQ